MRQARPRLKLENIDAHRYEMALFRQGFSVIAGVDEAGRGPLAGPVVAAAVILPTDYHINGLTDSKRISKEKRDELYDVIKREAIAVSVGVVESQEIDEINILQATLKAMGSAVDGLGKRPDHILIDGPIPIKSEIPQTTIIKGDLLSHTISAASVIAKVTRDRIMCRLEGDYPNFKFSIHKGYGTSAHLGEIKRFGPTPIHRMTFKGVI